MLIWLDSNIDESKDDSRKSTAKLRKVIKNVNTFTDANTCEEFLRNISEEKIFLIASGSLGQRIVPTIHDKQQINSIFVFCGDKSYHENWAKQYTKVMGVFTNIDPLCESIAQAIQKAKQDSMSVEFAENTQPSLDKLDPSYIYTKLFMEILVKINFTNEDFQKFIQFLRKECNHFKHELDIIDEFEKEYEKNKATWWYTWDSIISSVLNRALKTMDFTVLLIMGFYIQDLHRQIQTLYSQQSDEYHHYQSSVITAYFDEHLYCERELEILKKSQHGLTSFNYFLSCSEMTTEEADFHISSYYSKYSYASVIFRIDLDRQKSKIPIVFIKDYSGIDKKKILLATHSVFRVRDIQHIDENRRLYKIDLTLTDDQDPESHILEQHIRQEITGQTDWDSLTNLLFKAGQYRIVEELCKKHLEKATDKSKQSLLYYKLGLVSNEMGEYSEALSYHEKALDIRKKSLPPNHPDLARSYNDIGLVYNNIGEYGKALITGAAEEIADLFFLK